MTTLHPDIQREINKLYNDSELIELFVLDATAFGGPLFRFTNNPGPTGGGVVHNGLTYVPMPIVGTGFDITSTGTLPTPTITISNVNKVVQSAVITYGDLIGAKLTRIRTYGKFLDAATFPRRNLLNHSNSLSNAAWAKTEVTAVMSGAEVGPNSKMEVNVLAENLTTAVHSISNAAVVSGGQQYTFSAWLKQNGRNTARLILGQAAEFGATASADFDLSTGVVTGTSNSTAKIVDWGNGWYRCSVTGTATASGTTEPTIQIGTTSYLGTSAGLLVYGAQFENAAATTDYQFTSTSHQPFANPNAVISEKWKVEQMVEMTNTAVQFMLATDLDRIRFKFGRQVLKDASVKNVYAPGIARTRTR